MKIVFDVRRISECHTSLFVSSHIRFPLFKPNGGFLLVCSPGVVLVNVGLAVSPSSVLRFANQTYTASVPEHASRGTPVLTVNARVNGTSPAVYSLAVGDDIFSIDSSTGQ
jgi:hypothetical protein